MSPADSIEDVVPLRTLSLALTSEALFVLFEIHSLRRTIKVTKKTTANQRNAEAIERMLNAGASIELIQATLDLELEPPKKAKQIIEGEIEHYEQSEFEEIDE